MPPSGLPRLGLRRSLPRAGGRRAPTSSVSVVPLLPVPAPRTLMLTAAPSSSYFFLLAVRAHGRKAGQAGRRSQGALQGEEGCLGINLLFDVVCFRHLTPGPPTLDRMTRLKPCSKQTGSVAGDRLREDGIWVGRGQTAMRRRCWALTPDYVRVYGSPYEELLKRDRRTAFISLVARPVCPIPRRGESHRCCCCPPPRDGARPQTQRRRPPFDPSLPATEGQRSAELPLGLWSGGKPDRQVRGGMGGWRAPPGLNERFLSLLLGRTFAAHTAAKARATDAGA